MIAALQQILAGIVLGLLACCAFGALEALRDLREWQREMETKAAEARAWHQRRANDAR